MLKLNDAVKTVLKEIQKERLKQLELMKKNKIILYLSILKTIKPAKYVSFAW